MTRHKGISETMITNATVEELNRALFVCNQMIYDNNVEFNRLEQVSRNRVAFTLKVKDSHKKGARLSQSVTSKGNRRHLINACWHVHGDLFDCLFAINPDIFIIACGKKITRKSGNWEDRNIGSLMNPLAYSDACECEHQ